MPEAKKVYYIDDTGEIASTTMFAIDANTAVMQFPHQYSYSPNKLKAIRMTAKTAKAAAPKPKKTAKAEPGGKPDFPRDEDGNIVLPSEEEVAGMEFFSLRELACEITGVRDTKMKKAEALAIIEEYRTGSATD